MTLPVSARHSHVRRVMIGWGAAWVKRAAGQRQAVGDEFLAERRQESVGAGSAGCIVNEIGESRGQSHGLDHAMASRACHEDGGSFLAPDGGSPRFVVG